MECDPEGVHVAVHSLLLLHFIEMGQKKDEDLLDGDLVMDFDLQNIGREQLEAREKAYSDNFTEIWKCLPGILLI